MAYQSISGKGDSDSAGKLAAIRLPELGGKALLDIGCNEGFFCGEAVRRGAGRVVGIDRDRGFIARALERFPKVDFRCQAWDNLPAEKFDVVLMLSALHYEKKPAELMNRISHILNDDGVLILEVGVGLDAGKFWFEVYRSVGPVLYPSEPLLVDNILRDFAVRRIGPSVPQPGDPVHRHVYHCRKRRPTYVFFSAPSGSGKSTLARVFDVQGITTVSLDQLLIRENIRKYSCGEFAEYLHNSFDHNLINKWVDDLNEASMAKLAAEFIYNSLPKEAPVVVVEGYLLENHLVWDELLKILKNNQDRFWISSASFPPDEHHPEILSVID